MADFSLAFERMIANEGGYKLTNIKGDKGGQTYAGIARNRWPNWPGWVSIDQGDVPPSQMVRDFYAAHFWLPVCGDQILFQRIAENLFDFAVNAGVSVAVKLAQVVVGTTPDGKAGPKTIKALNEANQEKFVALYALAKIARYRDIVTKDHTQAKFLLGWINRTLKEAA
jgi:lysozyme family protein